MGSARGPAVASLVVGALLCGGCSYNPVIRDKPEREQVLIQAAALALARGDFDQAIQGFERVLERDPDHLQALLGSARANLSAREAEVALARFAAYRAQGGPWRSAEQWDYCRALALGSEQALELQEEPLRALELAESLVAEACADALAPSLILRSGLAVADRARRAGRHAHALEVYLSLLSNDSELRDSESQADDRGRLGQVLPESERARAYLGAAELLIEARRREDAIVLLSRGLAEMPGNRDLVHRMVSALADGTPVAAPGTQSSAESGSAEAN